MLFDRLLEITKVHLPEFFPIIDKARIFDFPYIPHELLPKALDIDLLWIEDNFTLPFSSIAVEDKASCIILADRYEKQRGLKDARLFIEAISLISDPKFFDDKEMAEDEIRQKQEFNSSMDRQGYIIVSVGMIDNMVFIDPTTFIFEGELLKTIIANKDKIFMEDFHTEETVKSEIRNAAVAIQTVMLLNKPENFILQETPLVRKKIKKDAINRSSNRPKYTLLRPGAIRKKIGLAAIKSPHSQFSRSTSPHERRRHNRYLSDEKYSINTDGTPREKKIIPYGKRKGETYYLQVDVPATWIGPSENIYKNKKYKILLDK